MACKGSSDDEEEGTYQAGAPAREVSNLFGKSYNITSNQFVMPDLTAGHRQSEWPSEVRRIDSFIYWFSDYWNSDSTNIDMPSSGGDIVKSASQKTDYDPNDN